MSEYSKFLPGSLSNPCEYSQIHGDLAPSREWPSSCNRLAEFCVLSALGQRMEFQYVLHELCHAFIERRIKGGPAQLAGLVLLLYRLNQASGRDSDASDGLWTMERTCHFMKDFDAVLLALRGADASEMRGVGCYSWRSAFSKSSKCFLCGFAIEYRQWAAGTLGKALLEWFFAPGRQGYCLAKARYEATRG